MIRFALVAAGLFAAPAVVFLSMGFNEPATGEAQFVIPNLSSRAYDGREHFAAFCGNCHGTYGEGTDDGPVLVHAVYAPTEFPDTAIAHAVRSGATARLWPFGDMPAIDGVKEEQLAQMIDFLREVQAANGFK